MRSMSLASLALLCGMMGQAQEPTITLVPVKYTGLTQEILKHRGKVLLVDFWKSD